MKKIIAGVGIVLTLVWTVALAQCITNVVVGRDGVATVCTTCCTNGQCVTTCV